MIIKTHGICLRFVPVSNTSRMVTWLTPDHGKIATLIKGAQRPKSMFLGQYDLFYTCEIIYYAREGREVKIARECCPLKLRRQFRTDWKAAATASYFADVITRISPPEAHHPGMFELLDDHLDELHEHGASFSLMFWFELRLLEHLGLAPRLQHCLACDQKLDPGSPRNRFSYEHGGILCGHCAQHRQDGTVSIAPDILSTLSAWQRARNPQVTRTTRCTVRQIDEMSQLLGWFLRYHLDTNLQSRDITIDVLSRKIA